MSPTAPANQNPGTPQNPGGASAAFGQLVQTAIQDPSRTADPAWILRSGELAPQLLCRYAVGQVSAPERRAVQELVTRHDWARGRVTSLVMAGRADAPELSLGRSVLAGAKSGSVDPYRITCAAALRSLEAPEAASAVENDDREAFEKLELSGLAQGLAQLAFSEDRTQVAGDLVAQGLAEESSSVPAVALALRVAASHDADEALVELLQAI